MSSRKGHNLVNELYCNKKFKERGGHRWRNWWIGPTHPIKGHPRPWAASARGGGGPPQPRAATQAFVPLYLKCHSHCFLRSRLPLAPGFQGPRLSLFISRLPEECFFWAEISPPPPACLLLPRLSGIPFSFLSPPQTFGILPWAWPCAARPGDCCFWLCYRPCRKQRNTEPATRVERKGVGGGTPELKAKIPFKSI